MSNIQKIIFIICLVISLLSSCKKNINSENSNSFSDENTISIFIDYDINEGTKQWLNSLKNDSHDYKLNFVTNVSTNQKLFIDNYISNNFNCDIVISKFLTQENSEYLADLSGKTFFPSNSFNSLRKMDNNGNIFLIPFTDNKKYLLINKQVFINNNLKPPKNAQDLLNQFYLLIMKPEILYINSDQYKILGLSLFNYAFSLTDGLTIKGFNWSQELENGMANVGDYDLTKTFDFIDNFIGINLEKLKNNDYSFSEAVKKFNNNEIGIMEISTNNLNQILPYFNENISAIPFYSPDTQSNYLLYTDQVYIGVNKKSMKNKKETLDNFLSKILGEVGNINVIFNDHSIYEPLYGLSSSVYDTFYKTINKYDKNQITKLYDFKRGKDYLNSAVEQYLLGEITRDEFVQYWQQDVLVSKFDLDKISLATTEDDLYPKDCSMLISKALYDQINCDISVFTYSSLVDNFDKASELYSSSPYFLKKGDIFLQDMSNLLPQNIYKDKVQSENQKLLFAQITGEEIINLLNNYENKLVYYGIKKINNEYYCLKENGSLEKIKNDKEYTLITNSNFYLENFNFPSYKIINKNIIDYLNKWIIENNKISIQSIYTYNIIAT